MSSCARVQVCPIDSQVAMSNEQLAIPMAKQSIKVLLVEDNPPDARLLEEYLDEVTTAQFDIKQVELLEEALKCLDVESFDIILLDLSLPDSQGFDTFVKIRRYAPNIPIVVLTSLDDETLAMRAMQEGAQDYLVKGQVYGNLLARAMRYAIERKRIELQLRQSEAKFRSLAENLQAAVWMGNPNSSNNFYTSPAYEKIWGRGVESLGDRPDAWIDAVYPEDREVVRWKLEQQIQGKPTNVEYRILQPDGSVRWIWDRSFAIPDERGEIWYLGGIAEDISERKQSEESLLRRTHQLEVLSRATRKINTVLKIPAVLGTLIAAAMELVGASAGVAGLVIEGKMTFTEYHQKGQIRPLNFTFEPGKGGIAGWLMLTKMPYYTNDTALDSYVGEMQRSLGVKNLAIVPIFSRKDELIGCLELHNKEYDRFSDRDITLLEGLAASAAVALENAKMILEYKQAEQKIREQAALLDVATDAIFVRDLDNQILFWNKGAERLYGWKPEEVLLKNTQDFLSKKDPTQQEVALKATIESGAWQGELHKVKKDGKEILVESHWTLVRDEAGNPKSILIVDTDITEKKQLETKFLRAQRLESLGTLASGIAHDLNNILTPVLAVAQLLPLKLPHLDEQSQRMLLMLETNAKRGADLVKQILSFARGAEGKRTSVQLKHLLLDIEQIAKRTFPKTIEIESDIPSELWTVSADATQLHQVFMNLVVNGRDAMPHGGTLSISGANINIDESYARMNVEATVGAKVVITVSDTGVGIPPEIIDRIFDPFFTTKEVGKGTGLGLSTVLGIVKTHGGFVEVSSQVGAGSEFKVYLPASEDTLMQAAIELELFSGNGELILVVDDEAAIREITKATLESYNYRVLTASDGIEAIAEYAEHMNEISLVLMDMMMPTMDGAIASRTLRKMNPQVEIIAMSGLTSSDAIANTTSIDIKQFLPKPFTAKELIAALQRSFKG